MPGNNIFNALFRASWQKAPLMFAAVTQALLYTKHGRKETKTSCCEGVPTSCLQAKEVKGRASHSRRVFWGLSLENSGQANKQEKFVKHPLSFLFIKGHLSWCKEGLSALLCPFNTEMLSRLIKPASLQLHASRASLRFSAAPLVSSQLKTVHSHKGWMYPWKKSEPLVHHTLVENVIWPI